MRRALVLLLALTLLAAPATAQAGWKLDRSLAVAQAVWSPTCGQMRVAYENPANAGLPEAAAGWAWEGDCTIRLPLGASYEFEQLCTIVVHEAGHVAGRGHSSNPRSVMYAEPLVTKTTFTLRGRTVVRWDGIDRRCRDRGRPYLERRGLL